MWASFSFSSGGACTRELLTKLRVFIICSMANPVQAGSSGAPAPGTWPLAGAAAAEGRNIWNNDLLELCKEN